LVGVSDGGLGRRPADGLSVSKRQAPSPCPGTPLAMVRQGIRFPSRLIVRAEDQPMSRGRTTKTS
jgi:hypothetical protein